MPDHRQITPRSDISGLAVAALSAMTLALACSCAAKAENPRTSSEADPAAGKPPAALPADPAAGEQPSTLPADPAAVEQLEPVFPEIAGWTRGPVTGKRDAETIPGATAPVPYAGVQATYSGPQTVVDASLVDSVDMINHFGHELDSDRSYQRITFQGHPAWKNRYGSRLQVLIKRRFLLTLETGTAHNDLAALTELAQKLDLGRLNGLD